MIKLEKFERVPQGEEIKEIVESYGWTLYDVTERQQDPSFTYEDMEREGPAQEFRVSHQYMFIPIPEKGQSLREAYAVTQGLGPILDIENPAEERWLGVDLYWTHTLAVFTRMMFATDGVALTSPRIEGGKNPDWVSMPYDSVVDTFRKYFRIISAVEFAATVHLSDIRKQIEDNRN